MSHRIAAAAHVALMLALAVLATPTLAASHGHPGATPATAQAHAPESRQSVTEGAVTIDGKRIAYKAITGLLVVRNAKGQPYVSMSYVAYIKQGVADASRRPVTFFYNGGPGSSSVWLHMLGFGPKLVVVGNDKPTPPAPYQLVNNGDSLLNVTDEVFIDAPGTGFGRIITKAEGGVGTPKMVYGVDQDARAFAHFIQQYLTANNRWNSPKFLYGESYGTMRSAVLANMLETDDNIALNGVILQSALLNIDIDVDFPKMNPGANNICFVLALPSYAATAWYHHKLPQQPADFDAFLKQVEHFAVTKYEMALTQGSLLSPAARQAIAEQLHQYTGLSTAYILKSRLRVGGPQFAHELLGDSDDITGRLDSRYSGPALDPLAEEAGYDTMDSAIDAPTVAEFNEYVRNTLDFGKDMTYKPQIDVFKQWDFIHKQPGINVPIAAMPNAMPDLADAMKHDPNLHILLLGGYFDLGTPFYAAEYEMHQLPIPLKLQDNISYHFFKSGHLVYLNPAAHKGLQKAAAAFITANTRTP